MRIEKLFMHHLVFATLLFCSLLLAMPLAIAQTSSAPSGKKAAAAGPKKHSLVFDDELVEGSTQKPELFYLFQKKNFNYKRLIKMRENFVPELKKNAEDVVKKTEK